MKITVLCNVDTVILTPNLVFQTEIGGAQHLLSTYFSLVTEPNLLLHTLHKVISSPNSRVHRSHCQKRNQAWGRQATGYEDLE